MHFSIPSVKEIQSELSGSSFIAYNIHINGCFHCSLRYKQLLELHQKLRYLLPSHTPAYFPPKKFFPLTKGQLETRRISLERYMQTLGQDQALSNSDFFCTFLLNAQKESSGVDAQDVNLDIYLSDGFRISVDANVAQRSSKVLEKACLGINLPADKWHYFSLFLVTSEDDGSASILRKLMDFEAPALTQKLLSGSKIVIRKSYWDPIYDEELMKDQISLNLLYIQAANDLERGLIIPPEEVVAKLGHFQTHGMKREFVELAQRLPAYGSLQFPSCFVNYPEAGITSTVIIGNRELCFRTSYPSKMQEIKFKITRMRCWRVTTTHNDDAYSSDILSDTKQCDNFELSFEYLISKNNLRWVTISSNQAVLMYVCLQDMVNELISQKVSGSYEKIKETHEVKESTAKILKNGHGEKKMSLSVSYQNISTHNEAFEGIGDDDL